jgi:phospholipase B1
MSNCRIFLICVLYAAAAASQSAASSLNYRVEKESNDDVIFIQQWQKIITRFQEDERLMEQYKMLESRFEEAMQKADTDVPEFKCQPIAPSQTIPTSVHALRPSDIKVIAALGVSITAGNGIRATKPWQVFAVVNRGESYSVGGDRNLEDGVVTLANILRKYNEDLKGFSQCSKTLRNVKMSSFNVAVPGATNLGLENQAESLIKKMMADATVDFEKDWKVITLFIGGNDLCQHCVRANLTGEMHKEGIRKSLDRLYKHVPRAFVNVQAMLDVGMVPDLIHPGAEELCDTLHSIECACPSNNITSRSEMRRLQLEIFDKIEELINTGKYDSRDDFTVVLQPHLRDQKPFFFPNGAIDMSYIAPDCFHPSYKSHHAFAFMLWNTMLTPLGSKPFEYAEKDFPDYVCPTEEHPYFYTAQNSPGYTVGGAMSTLIVHPVGSLLISTSTLLLTLYNLF